MLFKKIKTVIGNIKIEEFESHFLNFEFSGKTWKEQKKEMLTFILDYDYFLRIFLFVSLKNYKCKMLCMGQAFLRLIIFHVMGE